MIEQRVTHPPLKGIKGVALIAVIALLVIVLSNVFSALEPVLGSMLASLLFILCGMGVAGVLLNRYVLGFMYTCDSSCLRRGDLDANSSSSFCTVICKVKNLRYGHDRQVWHRRSLACQP